MSGWAINRASVSSDLLEGEVVAIHLGTGVYYSLRGSAATIWQALAAPAEVSTLVAAVTRAHEIDTTRAAEDVAGFLEQLRREELVVAGFAAAGAPSLQTSARQPYAPPVLERFADLQDLLLLDPIHDVGVQGWPHRAQPESRGSG